MIIAFAVLSQDHLIWLKNLDMYMYAQTSPTLKRGRY